MTALRQRAARRCGRRGHRWVMATLADASTVCLVDQCLRCGSAATRHAAEPSDAAVGGCFHGRAGNVEFHGAAPAA